MANTNRVGLAWPPGVTTGWGVLSLNLTVEMARRPDVHPFLLLPPHDEALAHPLYRPLLSGLGQEAQALADTLSQREGGATLTHPIIHSLTNGLQFGGAISERVKGQPNLGYLFLENTTLSFEAKARAKGLDLILAGCSWNEEVLRAQGVDNVVTMIQGVDTSLFHPAPRRGLFPGRFVVFGGGSLCHRKGQDIVLQAFKAFQQLCPEALLVTAWQNPAPWSAADITSAGLVETTPRATPEGIDVTQWMVENGLPQDACLDLGAVPNYMTPQILREAHVALFPNRAEGGTNMVAMEAMACGVPCILSYGHGHKDLANRSKDTAFFITDVLAAEASDKGLLAGAGSEGWVETPVEACLEALKRVYADQTEAKRRADLGAAFMRDWAWENRVGALLRALSKVV